jgi:hypothetical protein
MYVNKLQLGKNYLIGYGTRQVHKAKCVNVQNVDLICNMQGKLSENQVVTSAKRIPPHKHTVNFSFIVTSLFQYHQQIGHVQSFHIKKWQMHKFIINTSLLTLCPSDMFQLSKGQLQGV